MPVTSTRLPPLKHGRRVVDGISLSWMRQSSDCINDHGWTMKLNVVPATLRDNRIPSRRKGSELPLQVQR